MLRRCPHLRPKCPIESEDKLRITQKYLDSGVVQTPSEYMATVSAEELDSVDLREHLSMRRIWSSTHSRRVLDAMNGLKPSSIAQAISGAVLQHSSELVIAAFAGDVEAAGELAFSLDNCERGVVAYAMWKAKIRQDAFREYLSSVWGHDHHFVLSAARTRRRLASMFRYADFERPRHLPETVRVWRGTSHVTRKKAQSGYSWTTDRDAACWFAFRDDGPPERTLVLAADVPRDAIALYHDARRESEVVLLKPPESWIDGNLAEWEAASERHMREKEKRHRTANALTDEGRQARSATDRADPTA